MKTLLLFGYHSSELARNWILIEGLQEYGYSVEECRTEKRGAIRKYIDLTRIYWKKRKACDAIIVTFMGYYFVPLAWLLARLTGKKLIFDALVSMYESEVEDRKRLARWDPRAWFLYMFEWWCYAVSDLVLLESPIYKPYLAKKFHMKEKKFLALPVGCRSDVFHPAPAMQEHHAFRVVYQGMFIPVHSVKTIVDAASEIQKRGIDNVEFHFVGKGQEAAAMQERARSLKLTNVTFHGFLPTLSDVAEMVRQADVGLGMFQNSNKAHFCMPHKVYEVFASKIALITAETPATKEMLRDDVALFVPSEDPKALADAIQKLKEDEALKKRIAENGYRLFFEEFQPPEIMQPLAKILLQILK